MMREAARAWRGRASRAAVGAALLVAMLAVASASHAEVAIHRLAHRAAEELLPVVQGALAEGETASVDAGTNSIVLVGSASSIAAARSLLEQLDVARRSVLVRVESQSVRALRSAGWVVSWRGGTGDLAVGIGRGASGAAGQRNRAAGRSLSTARDDRFVASVRVLDGEVGRIETGRSVPITDRRPFGTTTTIVEASSGLLVRPRTLADGRVQLDIAPFEGDVSESARTRFMQAATSVVVPVDAVVVLGELSQQGSAAGGDVFATRSQDESVDDRVLLVSVDVE